MNIVSRIRSASRDLSAVGLSPAATVATLAALKALTNRPESVLVKGKTAIGDGWGGVFVWVSGSSTTADDALVVQCTSGAAGRYKRMWDEITGYAEWFSAFPGGADCLSGLLACIAACPVTQLRRGDYYISSILKIQYANRTLRGASRNYTGDSTLSTRIVVTGGSANAIQCGPDAEPATQNDCMQGIWVEDLQASRTAAPVISSGCAGIVRQFTIYGGIRGCKSVESMIGFHFRGTIDELAEYNYAFRSLAGTGGGSDYFRGFYVDGNTDIGASGGNASLTLNENLTGVASITLSNSQGVYLDNTFTDCAVKNHISILTGDGILAVGTGSTSQNYGNLDLIIDNAITDGFQVSGIRLKDVSKYGAINVIGGYSAPDGSSVSVIAGRYLDNCDGAVTMIGHQTIAGPNALCGSLWAVNSTNFTSIGNLCVDSATYITSIDGCSNFNVEDRSTNYTAVADAAVQFSNTNTAGRVAPHVSGGASKVTLGVVYTSTTTTYVETNVSGLDVTCINGGAASRITYNSGQVTSFGPFGTGNMASGWFDNAVWPNINVTAAYKIAGTVAMQNYATSYTGIYDAAGVVCAAFNSGNNFFYATTHSWQSSGGGTTYGNAGTHGLKALPGTAIPAGGTAGAGLSMFSTTNFGLFGGSGAPTLSAAQGSIYARSNGVPYFNVSGSTAYAPVSATTVNTQTGASYTIVDTDTHVVANRAGTITVTLPDASVYTNRAITFLTIQAQAVVSASSNVVPLAGGAAATDILAATAGKWAALVSNGTAWQIMMAN